MGGMGGMGGMGSSDGESEHIKAWRSERAALISALEEEAAAAKKEAQAQAKDELSGFFAQREKTIGSAEAATREAEEAGRDNRENEVAPGEEWTRVNDLVDFSRKANADVSRMRSLYLSLKTNPPAPAHA